MTATKALYFYSAFKSDLTE